VLRLQYAAPPDCVGLRHPVGASITEDHTKMSSQSKDVTIRQGGRQVGP